MQLDVLTFDGDPLDAVDDLTRPGRDHTLILVADERTWRRLSNRRRRPRRVTTRTRQLSVVSADLRRIAPTAADAATLLSRLHAERGDIVALHDGGDWSRSAFVAGRWCSSPMSPPSWVSWGRWTR
jgi:hypothetical protein